MGSLTNVEETNIMIPISTLDKALEVLSAPLARRKSSQVNDQSYPRQDILVELGLQSGHLDAQDALALRWKRSQHVPLEPPQHQRFKLLMELLDLLLVMDVVQIELISQGNYIFQSAHQAAETRE